MSVGIVLAGNTAKAGYGTGGRPAGGDAWSGGEESGHPFHHQPSALEPDDHAYPAGESASDG